MRYPGGAGTHAAILLVSAVLFSALLWRSYLVVKPSGKTDGPAPVAVEIKGDVPVPGTYLLDRERATVSDALSAAGRPGIAPDVSRGLESGESLTVIDADGAPRVIIGRMPASACLAVGVKLDLNSASEQDLMLIPLMRRDIAAAIVRMRRERPWEKVSDLAEIQGVGPRTANKLEEFLGVSPGGTK